MFDSCVDKSFTRAENLIRQQKKDLDTNGIFTVRTSEGNKIKISKRPILLPNLVRSATQFSIIHNSILSNDIILEKDLSEKHGVVLDLSSGLITLQNNFL